MKGIRDTSTQNFSSIISNGKFEIPKFQRDYSWDSEQWDDLWLDLSYALEHKDEHYMGYLVLQTADDKLFKIIDGQQRITTIILLILAAINGIKRLHVDNNTNVSREQTLRDKYIGYRDPVSLEYINKLVLNRNNDGYYKEYIVKLGDLRKTRMSSTEKLMKECFEWFDKKLLNKYSTGEEYASFIEKVADSLYFTLITVGDELNAFRVFETLNARGVQLSATDLLKNYLFSIVDASSEDEGRINYLEDRWAELNRIIGSESLPEFLRYYWCSCHKSVRNNELFRAIRAAIKTEKQVFDLVSEMNSYANVYVALKDENDDYWERNQSITSALEIIHLLKLKQPYSLLMVANKLLTEADFINILEIVINISFRYNTICGKNPNLIESVYNEVALDIYQNKSYNKLSFSPIYVDDREFVTSFQYVSFSQKSSTKLIRYILGKIETFKGGDDVDIHNDKNSIEHILPQSPSDEWGFSENEHSQYIYRLGNMCLLQKAVNIAIANASYDKKKESYRASSFVTTRDIAERYDNWDRNALDSRQADLARSAKGIWKVVF